MARRTLGIVALASIVGCGGGDEGKDGRSDSVAAPGLAAAPAGRPAPIPAPGDSTACPEDGRWRLCSVVDRLEDAGLVPKKQEEPVKHEFFSVPGTAFKVARGDLEVFIYDDVAAVARDVAALDTVRVAPTGELGPWRTRPAFIRSANLIAVYVSMSETQIERVQLALGAGPPQPKPDGAR
jgi:hypothetical protein